MNISPEVLKHIRARELDKDRQSNIRNQAYEKRMAELEADRDTWKLVAQIAIVFALIVPTYKICAALLPTVLELLK